ncbi:MAG TPA: restriction endonuclease subunit S [Candidatus Angelobacter sp.]
MEHGIPVLQGKNITNDTFRWFDVRFISHRKAEELKRSSVRVGDILVVKIGSIGYSAVIQDTQGFDFAIIPANLAKITPNGELVDTKYLHKWLTSPEAKQYLESAASKTAQPALSLGKIKMLPVPLPPLSEQRRIAAILDKADELRAKRCAIVAKLNTLIQSLFLDLFGHPDHNPKGFARKALGELCERVTVGYVGPMAEQYVESGIPLLRSLNVRRGHIKLADLKFVRPAFHAKLSKSAIRAGDVVTVRTGQPGTTAVVPGSLGEANCADLIVMTCGPSLDPHYLSEALNLWLGDAESIRGQVGAIQQHFNIGRAKELELILPPLTLQQEFVRRLAVVDKLKAAHRTSLSEMDALFASLQSRAFRGEL